MDPRIKNSLETLALEAAANEEPIYIVGGTLRDALLKRDIQDIDLACRNARNWAEGFACSNRSKCVTLHGKPGEEVYRIPLGKKFFCDFGTLQGTCIEEDLAHRDFTLNSLAQPLQLFLDGHSQRIDPFNGEGDIRRRVIRMLPGTPLEDDPLRMLRALRLAALLDFEVEPSTLKAIQNHCEWIAGVSVERISQELLKLFGTPQPCVDLLTGSGLLAQLRAGAGLQETKLIDPESVFRRWKQCREEVKGLLGKYCERYETFFADGENRALFGIAILVMPEAKSEDYKKGSVCLKESPAEKFMEHYRFSNQQRDFVAGCAGFASFIINQTGRTSGPPPSPSRMFQWCHDYDQFILPGLLLALLAHPDGDHPPESFINFLETLYVFYNDRYLPASKLEPLLTGNDLMKTFNLRPSPLFKTILNRVAEARVLGNIETREQAETLTRKFLDNPNANG